VRRRSACLYAGIVLLFIVVPSSSQAWEASAGYQSDNHGQYFSYVYGRATVSPPTAGLPFEPFVQLFAFRQRFFSKEEGHLLEAHLNQVAPSVGITKKIADLEISASAGAALREAQEQTVAGEKETTKDLGYMVNAEASYWMDNDGFEGIVSYTNLQDFFFGRARWKHIASKTEEEHSIKLNPGLEMQALGNSDFQAIVVGGLLETEVGNLVLLLKGGYQYDTTFRSGEYGGIELYLPF